MFEFRAGQKQRERISRDASCCKLKAVSLVRVDPLEGTATSELDGDAECGPWVPSTGYFGTNATSRCCNNPLPQAAAKFASSAPVRGADDARAPAH
jgi:hypothetical protein